MAYLASYCFKLRIQIFSQIVTLFHIYVSKFKRRELDNYAKDEQGF